MLKEEKAHKIDCDFRTCYDLKSKEALHILWEKPLLNVQVKHFNTKLTL